MNTEELKGIGSPAEIVEYIIRKHAAEKDQILRDAFREHFGFDITEVKDQESFEHIVQRGNPRESYRYRGETFLYVEVGEIEIDPYLTKPEWPQVKQTTRYIKV